MYIYKNWIGYEHNVILLDNSSTSTSYQEKSGISDKRGPEV